MECCKNSRETICYNCQYRLCKECVKKEIEESKKYICKKCKIQWSQVYVDDISGKYIGFVQNQSIQSEQEKKMSEYKKKNKYLFQTAITEDQLKEFTDLNKKIKDVEIKDKFNIKVQKYFYKKCDECNNLFTLRDKGYSSTEKYFNGKVHKCQNKKESWQCKECKQDYYIESPMYIKELQGNYFYCGQCQIYIHKYTQQILGQKKSNQYTKYREENKESNRLPEVRQLSGFLKRYISNKDIEYIEVMRIYQNVMNIMIQKISMGTEMGTRNLKVEFYRKIEFELYNIYVQKSIKNINNIKQQKSKKGIEEILENQKSFTREIMGDWEILRRTSGYSLEYLFRNSQQFEIEYKTEVIEQ